LSNNFYLLIKEKIQKKNNKISKNELNGDGFSNPKNVVKHGSSKFKISTNKLINIKIENVDKADNKRG
jgi:hypothetical protein